MSYLPSFGAFSYPKQTGGSNAATPPSQEPMRVPPYVERGGSDPEFTRAIEDARSVLDDRGNQKIPDGYLLNHFTATLENQFPGITQGTLAVMQQEKWKPGESATKLLNYWAYGNTLGRTGEQKAFQQQVAMQNAVNPEMITGMQQSVSAQQEAMTQDPSQGQGFFGRLGESVKSLPERFQRSFGNDEVRAGRQETSKGFDLADLPGDIADVAGAALPFAGSIISGTAAAPFGAPAGPAGAIATGVAGAAAGAGALEGGRQMIGDLMGVNERFGSSEPAIDLANIQRETIAGGAGELGGQLLFRGLGIAARPFAKSFQKEIADTAAKRGVGLPASAMTTSRVAPLLEADASKGIAGGRIGKMADEAQQKLTSILGEVVDDAGGNTDPSVLGTRLLEQAKKFRLAHISERSRLYKEADALLAERPAQETVDVTATKKFLDTILADKEQAMKILPDTNDYELLKTVRKNLEDTGKKASEIVDESGKPFQIKVDKRKPLVAYTAALDEIGKMIKRNDFLKTGDNAVLGKLEAILTQDIDRHLEKAAPEVFDALTKADEFASRGYKIMGSRYADTIKRWEQEPSKIVDAVLTPKSPEVIDGLSQLVGDDGMTQVRGAFLRKLLNESIDPKTKMLQGHRISGFLKKYGDPMLQKLLTPEQMDAVKDLEMLSNAMQKSGKITGGSQTYFLGKTGILLQNAFFHPLTGVPLLGAEASKNAFLSSKAGQQWLTRGFHMSPGLMKGAETAGRGIGQATTRIGSTLLAPGYSEPDLGQSP